MADKRRQSKSKSKHSLRQADSQSQGEARQRRLRRIGSERKSQPVLTSRPRRYEAELPSFDLRRTKRTPRAKSSSGKLPPVMARGGMEGMATRKSRRKPPKRRFDIPLGGLVADAMGAEVRIPALPGLHLDGRLLSGAMVLMLIICLVFIWQSPALRIAEIETHGFQRVTNAEITSVLGVVGESAFLIDTRQASETLTAYFPELKELRVKVSLPAKLEISAIERQPVLTWAQGDTELWVDSEGISFLVRGEPPADIVRVKAQSAPEGSLPALAEAEMTPLPGEMLVTAPSLRLPPDLVSAIVKIKSEIPQDAQLLYNAEHGLGWNDKQYGWKVFFGSQTDDIDQKLVVYQTVAAKLRAEGIKPVLVSVEFLHAPFYRMEQ